MVSASVKLGLTQASMVKVDGFKLGLSSIVTDPLAPSNLNACPISPEGKVTPVGETVPLLALVASFPFPSPRHQLIKPEGGGTQVASKRVKLNSLITDQVNCLDTFSGSFTYLDADRFDPGIYAPVVDGVDPDAAILAPAGQTLKDLVKCGAYRYWGPLASGIGGRNPSGTPYITAHLAALKKPAVYAAGNAYLPLPAIGFAKTATDGAYTIAFVPTTCPGAPPAEIPISATPNSSP